MTPTTFSKDTAVRFRFEMNKALEAVAKEFGVKIDVGNCTYSEIEMKFKVSIKTNDIEAIAQKEQTRWNDLCVMYGFKVEDFGKTFESRGTTYKIAGLDTRKPRFALKAINTKNGQMYGFDAESISRRSKTGLLK